MNDEQRSKIFQKLGFWEADISKVSLSCGKCNQVVQAVECNQKESKITDSDIYSIKLELFCPTCRTLVIGACV